MKQRGQSVANTTIYKNSSSEQSDLAGVCHAGEGPQLFQLFDVGLGQLVAAHGELLNGDKGLPFPLLHRVDGRRLAQPWTVTKGGSSPLSVTRNFVASDL